MSVGSNGSGEYLLDINWSIGSSTVTATMCDAIGNCPSLTLSAFVDDNINPEIIACREIQHLVQMLLGERRGFRGTLDFDKATAAVHDHVHVGFGTTVLGIIQVQDRGLLVNPDRDRGDLALDRVLFQQLLLDQGLHRIVQRHECA